MSKKKKILVIIASFFGGILLSAGVFAVHIYFSIQETGKEIYQSIEKEKEQYRNIETSLDYKKEPSQVNRENNNFHDKGKTPETIEKDNSTTFLLIGSDSRYGENSRSDTIMIGKYNQSENKALLISIPRDTYAEIPGHGYEKINHAYSYGGAALSTVTIENNFGVELEHYIAVDFQGFIKIVDAMGGIPIYVEKDMVRGVNSPYPINLRKGQQTLNGSEALAYARFRSDSAGDVGRMGRQQTVIKSVTDKLLTPSQLIKITKYLDIIGDNLKTDFTMDEIQKYTKILLKNPDVDIQFDTVVGDGGIGNDGLFYFFVSEEEKQKIKEKFDNF